MHLLPFTYTHHFTLTITKLSLSSILNAPKIMFSIHQKLHNHLLLLFILLISISCQKAQEIDSPIPQDPSIKCDTCPCDTCPAEPLAPPPLPPPPPPPPIIECPPPPPPPCPPPPSPPPPPKEPPCIPCMTKPPPPPRFYYSGNNNNLYVTEYNYSSGTRAKIAMTLVMMFFVGVVLFEGITFL